MNTADWRDCGKDAYNGIADIVLGACCTKHEHGKATQEGRKSVTAAETLVYMRKLGAHLRFNVKSIQVAFKSRHYANINRAGTSSFNVRTTESTSSWPGIKTSTSPGDSILCILMTVSTAAVM